MSIVLYSAQDVSYGLDMKTTTSSKHDLSAGMVTYLLWLFENEGRDIKRGSYLPNNYRSTDGSGLLRRGLTTRGEPDELTPAGRDLARELVAEQREAERLERQAYELAQRAEEAEQLARDEVRAAAAPKKCALTLPKRAREVGAWGR